MATPDANKPDLDQLAIELGLTDDQKAKLGELINDKTGKYQDIVRNVLDTKNTLDERRHELTNWIKIAELSLHEHKDFILSEYGDDQDAVDAVNAIMALQPAGIADSVKPLFDATGAVKQIAIEASTRRNGSVTPLEAELANQRMIEDFDQETRDTEERKEHVLKASVTKIFNSAKDTDAADVQQASLVSAKVDADNVLKYARDPVLNDKGEVIEPAPAKALFELISQKKFKELEPALNAATDAVVRKAQADKKIIVKNPSELRAKIFTSLSHVCINAIRVAREMGQMTEADVQLHQDMIMAMMKISATPEQIDQIRADYKNLKVLGNKSSVKVWLSNGTTDEFYLDNDVIPEHIVNKLDSAKAGVPLKVFAADTLSDDMMLQALAQMSGSQTMTTTVTDFLADVGKKGDAIVIRGKDGPEIDFEVESVNGKPVTTEQRAALKAALLKNPMKFLGRNFTIN